MNPAEERRAFVDAVAMLTLLGEESSPRYFFAGCDVALKRNEG